MDEQQALNAPYVVDWNGRILKFSGVTQGVKAACVSACKLRAIHEQDELIALRFLTDEQKRRESNRQFEDTIRSGRYGWSHDGEGDLLSEWRSTPEGVLTFSEALLAAGGTPLNRDELREAMNDLRNEFGIILRLVLLDASDPKGKRSPAAIVLSDLLKSLTSTESSQKSHSPAQSERLPD